MADTYFPGDSRVLVAARAQIRSNFQEKATLTPSDPELLPAIKHAEEVADFLKSNVVQGRKEGGGDLYSMFSEIILGHSTDSLLELRIHKDTERGDNDTIKLGNKTIKIDGKKCSDR